MGRRLTRKEIVQEDRIRSVLTRLYAWAAERVNYLVAGLVLVILTLGGVYLWDQHQLSREQELQARFGEALRLYHARVGQEEKEEGREEDALPVPGTELRFDTAEARDEKALNAFRAIVAERPGSSVGHLARYYLALVEYRRGNPQEAADELRSLIETTPHAEVKNLARNSLAHVYLAEERHEEAVVLLEEILDQPSPYFPKQSALLRLAQVNEALGNLEEAVSRYKQLGSEYPAGEYSQQAQSRINQLEAELSERQ